MTINRNIVPFMHKKYEENFSSTGVVNCLEHVRGINE